MSAFNRWWSAQHKSVGQIQSEIDAQRVTTQHDSRDEEAVCSIANSPDGDPSRMEITVQDAAGNLIERGYGASHAELEAAHNARTCGAWCAFCITDAEQVIELARLSEQAIQQQARIVELRDALEQSALDSATHGVTCGAVTILRAKALTTTDDLSALKAHDDAIYNDAIDHCIVMQKTGGKLEVLKR